MDAGKEPKVSLGRPLCPVKREKPVQSTGERLHSYYTKTES